MYGLLLLVLLGELCYAQDIDPHVDDFESLAVIEALDEFGLDLDSPELEGMDGGEVWGYIDRLRSETKAFEQ